MVSFLKKEGLQVLRHAADPEDPKISSFLRNSREGIF